MMERRYHQRRDSTSSSEFSDYSYHSRSTAPTDYSGRPSVRHQDVEVSYCRPDSRWECASLDDFSDPRCSAATYASTVPLEADADEEYPVFEDPPDLYYEAPEPTASPSTPSGFASYFPSTRRLCVPHADPVDGNMHRRVDTDFHLPSGERAELTLFHLRMHDLKNRDFSLRRYCRDSGREVCHSSRKYTKPAADRRPALQRSVSNALATLKSLSDPKRATKTSLKRTDSGYDSMPEDDTELDAVRPSTSPSEAAARALPTNTTNLEFANYAHVDLKRRGAKASKRYEFEYWGQRYTWRRVVSKEGPSRVYSYHLYSSDRAKPIAHIVPLRLSPHDAVEEVEKGGWVPPSSMWLSDPTAARGSQDVAEYVLIV